jgi:nucleoside-diphosphate-sugar epimerase
MARVAIIGGHGNVALRLSRLLTEQGHQVTSLFRNPEQTDDVRQTGARPVVLDVEESSADEIARRMGGHDALVWSAGAGGGNPARTYAVDRDAAIRSMDAAGQAGVGRYIMVSYLGPACSTAFPKTIRSLRMPKPRPPRTTTCGRRSWTGRSWARAGSRWRSRPAGSRWARTWRRPAGTRRAATSLWSPSL